MSWEKINEMFPDGGVNIDGKFVTNEEIKNNGTDSISFPMERTIRGATQEIKRHSYYPNGDYEVTLEYSVFPPNPIDGVPLLNAYAQKEFNDFCYKHDIPYSPISMGNCSIEYIANMNNCECEDSQPLTFEEFIQQQ